MPHYKIYDMNVLTNGTKRQPKSVVLLLNYRSKHTYFFLRVQLSDFYLSV